ncbi:MAG TPA: Tex-like N-terminal domain-containing protein, partial [Bacilli bacterium]|nr:Tex-like N-terminal domain-containing protein [Bacilli bacterium]
MVEDYVSNEIKLEIARDNDVSVKQIDAVLKLIEEGGTVPFIARYRKEATGGLDEKQIRSI